jgi:hypothetical protein
MVNPFVHAGKAIGELWTMANHSDCAPGPAKIGVVLIVPIVAPCAFVAALFKNKKTV